MPSDTALTAPTAPTDPIEALMEMDEHPLANKCFMAILVRVTRLYKRAVVSRADTARAERIIFRIVDRLPARVATECCDGSPMVVGVMWTELFRNLLASSRSDEPFFSVIAAEMLIASPALHAAIMQQRIDGRPPYERTSIVEEVLVLIAQRAPDGRPYLLAALLRCLAATDSIADFPRIIADMLSAHAITQGHLDAIIADTAELAIRTTRSRFAAGEATVSAVEWSYDEIRHRDVDDMQRWLGRPVPDESRILRYISLDAISEYLRWIATAGLPSGQRRPTAGRTSPSGAAEVIGGDR